MKRKLSLRKLVSRIRKKNRHAETERGRVPRGSRGRAGEDSSLRKQVAALLTGGDAHATFEAAVKDFPPELAGAIPPGAAHSAWQLVEHMRIAQWDFVEFCRNPKHVSPEFPSGYWPATAAPPDAAAWQKSVRAFLADRAAMVKLILNPRRDLFARVNHPESSDKHILLREALVLADHNSYHLGQVLLLRRLLGAWK